MENLEARTNALLIAIREYAEHVDRHLDPEAECPCEHEGCASPAVDGGRALALFTALLGEIKQHGTHVDDRDLWDDMIAPIAI